MLPSYAGSKNFFARVVMDLATEREKRKRAQSADLRPPRIVELLARAEEFQRLLDSGESISRADLARRFTLSRARVTQILNLLLLDPSLRAALATLRPSHGGPAVTERGLRCLTGDQEGQAALAASVREGCAHHMPPPEVVQSFARVWGGNDDAVAQTDIEQGLAGLLCEP